MASVASELSAVHHGHAGLGLRGHSQAASHQDSADSFGSLLDGSDNSPPPPAPAARPAPPSSSAPKGTPPGAPDQSADQPKQAPAAAAAQTSPRPTSAQVGVQNQSDDGKDGGAAHADAGSPGPPADAGPPAPIVGKAATPFIAAILDAGAKISGVKAPGPTVPADPNGSTDATNNDAGQVAAKPGAGLPGRHDDKTDKSDGSGSAQAPTVPGADSTLASLVAPVPQPIALTATASTPIAGDDDGADITELAAAGRAARPSGSGAQTGGTNAAAADSTAGGQNQAGAGEDDDAQASTQPASAPAPNSTIVPERANAASTQPPPNSFANQAGEPETARNLRPHGAFRASVDGATAATDRDQPSITSPDAGQKASATTTPNLDSLSAAAGAGRPVVDHDPPSNPLPDPGSSAAAPDSLTASAGAAPPAATAPASQAVAPAPTTAAAAVPIAGLAVEIASRAHAGKNRFEIRLDPPDLGRIDVRLDVDHDGKVTSHLVVERQDTLDALRRDAPQIERSLQQAGLKTADNGLQFTLRDQSFGQQNSYPRHEPLAGGVRIVVPNADLPSADAVKGRYGGIAGLGSGIDIRV